MGPLRTDGLRCGAFGGHWFLFKVDRRVTTREGGGAAASSTGVKRLVGNMEGGRRPGQGMA